VKFHTVGAPVVHVNTDEVRALLPEEFPKLPPKASVPELSFAVLHFSQYDAFRIGNVRKPVPTLPRFVVVVVFFNLENGQFAIKTDLKPSPPFTVGKPIRRPRPTLMRSNSRRFSIGGMLAPRHPGDEREGKTVGSFVNEHKRENGERAKVSSRNRTEEIQL
jgi:hypothetical protein